MVTFIFIGVALLLAAVAVLLLRTPATPARSQAAPRTPAPASAPASAPVPLPVPGPNQPLTVNASAVTGALGAGAAPIAPPPALVALRFVLQDELSPDYRKTMVEELRHIPQPAPSLQKLVSKDFMTRATTKELGELVMSNPLLAAKVLATVNSPFYGLQT